MPPKNFDFPPQPWHPPIPPRSRSNSMSSDINVVPHAENYPNPMMPQQFQFAQAGPIRRPIQNQDPGAPVPPMRNSASVFNLSQSSATSQAPFHQQNQWGYNQQVIMLQSFLLLLILTIFLLF